MTSYTADTLENRTPAGPSAVFTYRRTGPQRGVPVVLLMRFRGALDWWDPEFIDRLAQDRDVIFFDNVGRWRHRVHRDPRPDAGPPARLATRRDRGAARRAAQTRPRAQAAASGLEHLAKVSKRLQNGGPAVTEEAAYGQLAAVARLLTVNWDQLKSELQAVSRPVLYANGIHDVMIPAVASYQAAEQVPDSTLVLYSDAGHAFLFQHIDEFAAQVNLFLAD